MDPLHCQQLASCIPPSKQKHASGDMGMTDSNSVLPTDSDTELSITNKTSRGLNSLAMHVSPLPELRGPKAKAGFQVIRNLTKKGSSQQKTKFCTTTLNAAWTVLYFEICQFLEIEDTDIPKLKVNRHNLIVTMV